MSRERPASLSGAATGEFLHASASGLDAKEELSLLVRLVVGILRPPRILGESPEDPICAAARNRLSLGVLSTSSMRGLGIRR